MENKNKIHFECALCGKIIPKGKQYICLERNVEKIIADDVSKQELVEIIDSNVLLIFCKTCGKAFNDKKLSDLIKNLASLNK